MEIAAQTPGCCGSSEIVGQLGLRPLSQELGVFPSPEGAVVVPYACDLDYINRSPNILTRKKPLCASTCCRFHCSPLRLSSRPTHKLCPRHATRQHWQRFKRRW